MNKKIAISAVCISVLATACTTEDYVADNTDAKQLLLATAVEAPEIGTRAGTNVQSTQFVSGQTVGVWTFTGTGTSAEFQNKNVSMSTDGNGGLSGNVIFYDPATSVNVWAVHPCPSSTMTAAWDQATSQTLGFNVGYNQYNQDEYLNADFCVGHLFGIKADGTKHVIPMKHMMSKITINILDGDANDGFTVDNAHINYVSVWSRYITEYKTNNTRANNSDPIASITASGGITMITAANNSSTDKLHSSVIVPPGQTYAAGDKILFIMPEPAREPMEYKLPSALTLESGKEYIFNVNIKLKKIDVNVEIKNWDTVDKTGVIQY